MSTNLNIFSGKQSKDLWDDIHAVRNEEHDALYHLACRCQDLESVVEDLIDKLDDLTNVKAKKIETQD
jgi:hypothetical protein